MGDGRIGELGEKDVLRALYDAASHFHASAESGLPEGQIEHMMQPEGNQCPLHQTVKPGSGVAGFHHHTADSVDAGLDDGPDVIHQNADGGEYDSADDRNEAGSAEEGEHLRQLDFIETVMKRGHAKADNDAAEHAHLQGGDAKHGSGGAVQHGLRAAVIVDHGADGSMHDKKGDGGGKSGNFLFLLRHADGHAHGENDGKVGEYDVARGA